MINHIRLSWICITVFFLMAILSISLVGKLQFSFDFNQFFPKGDPDLQFYDDFMDDFGADDSFLLIAIRNEPTVFNQSFLDRFHKASLAANKLPSVRNAQSLTTMSYPLRTSMGFTALPVIHLADTTRYTEDWEKIRSDKLFINQLIDSEAKSVVLALETEAELGYPESVALMNGIRDILRANGLVEYHILGRASFYQTIVDMQKKELVYTTLAALVVMALILYLVYRRFRVVGITLLSVCTGLLLFMAMLSLLGSELNLIALFYPLLLIIVGTSDVIHILDAYLREIAAGASRRPAITSTLKEVGLSTLLTSLTTAVGFASLLFSKLDFIRDFGIYAAIGVLIMYGTVIILTSSLLLVTPLGIWIKKDTSYQKWTQTLLQLNNFTKVRPTPILYVSAALLVLFIIGSYQIDTNFQFRDSLPKSGKITRDFDFFQTNYVGFRPLEVAVIPKGSAKVTDYKVALEVEKIAAKMDSSEYIGNVRTQNILYKAMNRAHHLNLQEYYNMPDSESIYKLYGREARRMAGRRWQSFVNDTGSKGRIAANVLDIGSDSLLRLYDDLRNFIRLQTDTTLVDFRLTGKGLLLDRNAVYIRTNLLQGLAFALILVSIMMVLLFRNIKLVFISLIPNVLPLLFAAAVLGFLNIPLEATVSIVFAIAFGIAVDDTIHFLTKYKLCLLKDMDKDAALKKTFAETGRALVITTGILISVFLTLLFSDHQPSATVGIMLSCTLLMALLFDLFLLPVLIRKWL